MTELSKITLLNEISVVDGADFRLVIVYSCMFEWLHMTETNTIQNIVELIDMKSRVIPEKSFMYNERIGVMYEMRVTF